MGELKDERLVELSEKHNVAQFVSFSPGLTPRVRHSRIRGQEVTSGSIDIRAPIETLLSGMSGSINVRSFRPEQEKGNPFKYGIIKVDEAVSIVRALASDGYFTIVNETIDTADGGVSGVVLGGIMEFVPLDTPRGVEKPGAVSLPFDLGVRLLHTVYGFRPDISAEVRERLEFSIHPIRVGYKHTHTVLWEIEQIPLVQLAATVFWPNRFSKFIGDKAYGLLIAHLLDLPVPATTVISRRVAPFQFGRSTDTAEIWMRTCPAVQTPGHFPTTFGWEDPYSVMAREDPDGSALSSILAQEGVDAAYSGASLPGEAAGTDFVEGVKGRGDQFMLGRQQPEILPPAVLDDVRAMVNQAARALGPVRVEFAHDGQQAWVVQLHLAAQRYRSGVISPGNPDAGWIDFHPDAGLDRLSQLIEQAAATRRGIRVIGQVGLTSHVGDLLRKSRVPAQLQLQSELSEVVGTLSLDSVLCTSKLIASYCILIPLVIPYSTWPHACVASFAVA